MKYSYFIADDKYDRFDSPEHTDGNDDYLGREDSNGDCWKCCMTKEDADKAIADHTNEDGSIDYDGLNEDLGLPKGTLDENSHRVDFETDGEIRNTEKGGINDNGQCTGDGKLPGGYSDLEAKNVPRENAIDRGQLGSMEKGQDNDENKKDIQVEDNIKGEDDTNDKNNTESKKQSENQNNTNIEDEGNIKNESADNGKSNDDGYDYYNSYMM